MKLIWSPQASESFAQQLNYLIDKNAPGAAHHLNERVDCFVRDVLLAFPGHGRPVPGKAFLATWIPRTRIVLWYRFDEQSLENIDVWHTSQDRQGAE